MAIERNTFSLALLDEERITEMRMKLEDQTDLALVNNKFFASKEEKKAKIIASKLNKNDRIPNHLRTMTSKF